MLAIGFLLSGVFVVHLPVRKDAHSLSLSEVLMVLGLALATPAGLIVGRLGGSATALVLHRRQRPTKLAFNLALAYLETTAAIAAYRRLLGGATPAGPGGWWATFAAVGIAVVVGLGMVTWVIALHDRRRSLQEVLRSLAAGGAVSLGAGLIGLVYLLLVWADPRNGIILTVLTPLVYGAVAAFSGLAKQHRDLQAVYDFAREIHRPLMVEEMVTTTLDQVRRLLRAELADVVMFREGSADIADRTSIGSDGTVRNAELDKSDARDLARLLLANPVERVFSPARGPERLRVHYARVGFDNGIVAPVSGPGGITAILAAGNRLGPVQTFDRDDLRLLEVLAKQFSDTMARGRLVRLLQEEAAERERQAANLIRSKDEFLASVSHELRTPLTAVHAGAELLREQLHQLEQSEVVELVECVARESGEMADIIEDLLVAARADIGNLTIKMQRIDLQAEIEGTLASVRNLVGAQHIRTRLRAGTAQADPLRFRQIMRNLLTNALRYGGTDIEIYTEHRDGQWAVIVSDDGPGIPRESREAIFVSYQRAHQVKGVTGSVGLGLTVARRLAELMGGSLGYRHQLGRSSFELRLNAASTSTSRHLRAVS